MDRVTVPDPIDLVVRVLRPDEYRAARDLFSVAVHHPPVTDQQWAGLESSYEPDRTLGGFVDGELVGTAMSFASRIGLPGGTSLPLAAVTDVGVRADHTRRGVATALIRELLVSVTEPLARLWASEGEIYGRFGFGISEWGGEIVLDRRTAVLRPDAPTGGAVRLVSWDEALKVLPEIFERTGLARNGAMTRPDFYWRQQRVFGEIRGEFRRIAVHRGPDGVDDGFVMFFVAGRDPHRLNVIDLHTANPRAWAGLWRFLLGVDLVDEVRAEDRPLDEPLRWLFTDPRACRVAEVGDGSWLRLVDVPSALAARSYRDGEPVVIEVSDPFLPANSGRYRISVDGAVRTDEPAGIALDVSALASLYLGGTRASALAAAGRLRVLDPAALARADRLFDADVPPWCGTFF